MTIPVICDRCRTTGTAGTADFSHLGDLSFKNPAMAELPRVSDTAPPAHPDPACPEPAPPEQRRRGRTCKTPADLRRDALASRTDHPELVEGTQHPLGPAEYQALVRAHISAHPEPVEGRAPNMREFTLNSRYAWDLFRPEPSMLPNFPLTRHNPVERDKG